MNDRDLLKEFFAKKLQDYEANVDPALWSSISSKLGSSSVASNTSFLSKIIIGTAISAASVISGIFLYNSFEEHKDVKKSQVKPLIEGDKLVEKIGLTNLVEETREVVLSEKREFISKVAAVNISRTDEKLPLVKVEHLPLLLPFSQMEKDPEKEIVESIVTIPQSKVKERIPLLDELIIEKREENVDLLPQIKLPSIFTPNNDGSNDYFLLDNIEELFDFSVVVMNSKSELVFKSDDPHFTWDGVDFRGNEVEDGLYLYYITAFDANGRMVNRYQSLKIVR
jgi:gliding motility-associated-like protein